MAQIVSNERIAQDVFLLTLNGVPDAHPGQFLQVHIPDGAMLLPRPISVFDCANGFTRLLYRVVGKGTEYISHMTGGELCITGPLGNGFPLDGGSAVLIGGGLGIAPLRLLGRELRRMEPDRSITVALGFGAEEFLTDEYREFADDVIVDIGGFITDRVDFARNATYYVCGPTPMMRTAAARGAGRMYVSLERRMACGVGACLACSVATREGNRRVCRDGPVFDARDVLWEVGI